MNPLPSQARLAPVTGAPLLAGWAALGPQECSGQKAQLGLGGSHLVMSQLERELHEGVRAGFTFLDQPFTESAEWEGVEIHVVGQEVGAAQRSLNDLLTLGEKGERASLNGRGSSDTN